MINFFQIFSFVVVWAAVSHSGQVNGEGSGDSISLPPECTSEFQKYKDNHTMCIYFDDERVTKSGVSDADKKIIVDLHNRLRGEVSPPATDLSKLVWDDKIAAVAQKWAKQCRTGHDKNKVVPSYGLSIGQNAAAGQSNWEKVVMAWYNEVELFKYGEDPSSYLGGEDGWKKVGHYTQVVQNTTYRIGCGYAECSSTKYGRYYVCNYGEGQSNIPTPYTEGDRCSACPSSCKNGVCDCDGKMCLNDGELDIDRCTCICPIPFIGNSCETVHCPATLKDDYSCWKSFTPPDCAKFSNVPSLCPWMCGICGPEGATPPPVFKSDFGCVYEGQRPSEVECKTFGDKGADKSLCASNGGQYNCDYCVYSNFKTDYCPVMCGMCAP